MKTLAQTIIIPFFNGLDYIFDAVKSVNELHLDKSSIEKMIIDDGSEEKLSSDFLLEYRSFNYYYKANGGVSSALNLGLQKMQGDYFNWLSHDDYYPKSRFDFFDEYNSHIDSFYNSVIVLDSVLVNSEGKIIKTLKNNNIGLFSGLDVLRLILEKKTNINGCAVIINKHIIKRNGFFDENYRYVQDLDYWIRLCLNGTPFLFIPKNGVYTRIHKGQGSNNERHIYREEIKLLLNKLFIYVESNRLSNSYLVLILTYAVKTGNYRYALLKSQELCSTKSIKFSEFMYVIFTGLFYFPLSLIKKYGLKMIRNCYS
jgi:glycosyltransferase involved in cell wall biosynthesis